MTYKNYEIIRVVTGNAARWHATDETGRRVTNLGFKSKAAVKRFLSERDLRRIHTPRRA